MKKEIEVKQRHISSSDGLAFGTEITVWFNKGWDTSVKVVVSTTGDGYNPANCQTVADEIVKRVMDKLSAAKWMNGQPYLEVID